MRRVAVLLLLGTAACGNEGDERAPVVALPEWATAAPQPCSDDRAELLRRVPDAIADDSMSDWIARAYRSLRVAEKAIDGPDLLELLPDMDGRRRLARANVVLLGNRHPSRELASVRHRLILQLLSDGWARPFDAALVLECVPVKAAERLRRSLKALRTDGGTELRELLQDEWPWPVEPYVTLLRELVPLDVQVFPAGSDLAKWVPDRKVQDETRWPQGETADGPAAFAAWKAQFNTVNRTATKAALTWIDGGSHRRAVIDCGLLHHFEGRAAIANDLQEAGLHVVIEIGFIKEIETALLARFGADTCRSWFDLGSGLIRCPYPRLAQIVAEDWGKRR